MVDKSIGEGAAKTVERRYLPAEAALVFLSAACLYVPFLSQQFDLNGIAEANSLEVGALFSGNHLLYRPLGLVAVMFARFLGFAFSSIRILQMISAVAGAASVALAYVFFRGLDCSRFAAAAAAVWLATTWAYWVFSTDAMYIPIAAMFVAGACAALLGQNRPSVIVSGALMGFAVTTWEANVLLIPFFPIGVCLFSPRRRWEMLVRTGHFVWACFVPICALYLLGAALSGILTPRAFVTWVTSHGNGVGLPMWGQFDFSRIPLAARTAANSIVPLPSLAWQRVGALAVATLLLWCALTARSTFQRRTAIWLAGAYLVLVLFNAWWDPWEAKWFVIPNIFLGALLALLLQFIVSRRAEIRTNAAKASVAALLAVSAVTNFRSTVWGRHYTENANLELSRCVASQMRAKDVFLSTDWSWSGYLGYFFNKREVSVIDVSAALGEPGLALEVLWQDILLVQKSGGSGYMMDMASYPKKHIEWLESQTRLRYEDLAPYQGKVAFECRGIPFRRIPLVEPSDPDYTSADRFKLSVSSKEVNVGEKYRITISNVSRKSAFVRYRLNDGPVEQFLVHLDARGSVEFDIGPTTQKGLYKFVGFQLGGRIGWIMADASIRVR